MNRNILAHNPPTKAWFEMNWYDHCARLLERRDPRPACKGCGHIVPLVGEISDRRQLQHLDVDLCLSCAEPSIDREMERKRQARIAEGEFAGMPFLL